MITGSESAATGRSISPNGFGALPCASSGVRSDETRAATGSGDDGAGRYAALSTDAGKPADTTGSPASNAGPLFAAFAAARDAAVATAGRCTAAAGRSLSRARRASIRDSSDDAEGAEGAEEKCGSVGRDAGGTARPRGRSEGTPAAGGIATPEPAVRLAAGRSGDTTGRSPSPRKPRAAGKSEGSGALGTGVGSAVCVGAKPSAGGSGVSGAEPARGAGGIEIAAGGRGVTATGRGGAAGVPPSGRPPRAGRWGAGRATVAGRPAFSEADRTAGRSAPAVGAAAGGGAAFGFVTMNECPHRGQRILRPVGGTRRSSTGYGALHDSHSTFNIRKTSVSQARSAASRAMAHPSILEANGRGRVAAAPARALMGIDVGRAALACVRRYVPC